MDSGNQSTETKNIDPFSTISIRGAGFDEGDGVKEEADYSLADAIRVGEVRAEEALGFSINGSYFKFPAPMELDLAALCVLAIVSQFGTTSGVPLRTSIEILEAYFTLVQDRDEEMAFDQIPPPVVAGRAHNAYVGHFLSLSDFLNQMREDYEDLDVDEFAYRIVTCSESINGHYFHGKEYGEA